MKKLIKTEATIVKKGWGHEVQIVNNAMYCGKVLHYDAGARMSMHYHIDKTETWYVAKGSIIVSGIYPNIAERYEIEAKAGDVIHINRGVIHQIFAIQESDVFEVSTPDSSDDNYRVGKGDSQTTNGERLS